MSSLPKNRMPFKTNCYVKEIHTLETYLNFEDLTPQSPLERLGRIL